MKSCAEMHCGRNPKGCPFSIEDCDGDSNLDGLPIQMYWPSEDCPETMPIYDRYKALTAKFCSDTGMLALGKDQSPALCGTPSMVERYNAWDKWIAELSDEDRRQAYFDYRMSKKQPPSCDVG